MLLSTAYLPPVSYIRACLTAGEITIDRSEHFVKQTYRNRCHIYSANGLLPLVIPVEHKDLFGKPISEVRISYDENWQKIHWRSMTSAYGNAPFFEYYEDAFRGFYSTNYEFLLEFNTALFSTLLQTAKAELKITFTDVYEKIPLNKADRRTSFHPKHPSSIDLPPYHQVFADRHGFLADLSAIDWLFNTGSFQM